MKHVVQAAASPLVWIVACDDDNASIATTMFGDYMVKHEAGRWQAYPPRAAAPVAIFDRKQLAYDFCREHYVDHVEKVYG